MPDVASTSNKSPHFTFSKPEHAAHTYKFHYEDTSGQFFYLTRSKSDVYSGCKDGDKIVTIKSTNPFIGNDDAATLGEALRNSIRNTVFKDYNSGKEVLAITELIRRSSDSGDFTKVVFHPVDVREQLPMQQFCSNPTVKAVRARGTVVSQ